MFGSGVQRTLVSVRACLRNFLFKGHRTKPKFRKAIAPTSGALCYEFGTKPKNGRREATTKG